MEHGCYYKNGHSGSENGKPILEPYDRLHAKDDFPKCTAEEWVVSRGETCKLAMGREYLTVGDDYCCNSLDIGKFFPFGPGRKCRHTDCIGITHCDYCPWSKSTDCPRVRVETCSLPHSRHASRGHEMRKRLSPRQDPAWRKQLREDRVILARATPSRPSPPSS